MIELDDKKTILQNRVRNSRKKHERICYNAKMIKNSHNSDATKNPELDLGVSVVAVVLMQM